MNKYKIILSVLMITVVIYANGCLMGKANYTAVKYYGLRSSRQILPAATSVRIDNISTIGGTGTRMAFKTGQCRVLVDEYHRWVNTPATMITIALQSSFSGTAETLPANATEYNITATVFEFIADVEHKTATLGINYRIKNKTGEPLEDSVTFTIPLKSVEPNNYAVAMSKAVEQLAERISKEIKNIKRK